MKITFIKDTDVIDLVTAADVLPLMCDIDPADEVGSPRRKWVIDDEELKSTSS